MMGDGKWKRTKKTKFSFRLRAPSHPLQTQHTGLRDKMITLNKGTGGIIQLAFPVPSLTVTQQLWDGKSLVRELSYLPCTYVGRQVRFEMLQMTSDEFA